MPRSASFALVCAIHAWVLGFAVAAAQPPPPPPPPPVHVVVPRPIYGEHEGWAFHQRAAGAIDGKVIAIDYRSGTITVHTQHRGIMEVIVLPSTSIEAQKTGFDTIADIVPGERVHVLLSRRGNNFIAQIINLR
jgi:hypothetical protein